MKIGIITIHKSPSFGGCLQSYALFKYLDEKGFDTEIIDLLRPTHQNYKCSIRKFYPRTSFINKLKILYKLLLHKDKPHSRKTICNEKFEEFNNRIKYSKTYYGVDEIYNVPPQYDVCITGSDQVWNPQQPYIIEPYFLTFIKDKNIKKISYAASMGVNKVLPKEEKKIKKWLEEYDHISVREDILKQYLETFVKKKITRVADPTYLLERSSWKKLAIPPTIKGKYILLFELSYSQQLVNFCKRISIQAEMPLIVLCQKEPDCTDDSYIVISDAGPLEFLGYIQNAEMVITDSFHATVFSIILEAKNFYTYIAPENPRGSRIIDILKNHALSSHLLIPDLKQRWEELAINTIDKKNLDFHYRQEQSLSRMFLDTCLDQ